MNSTEFIEAVKTVVVDGGVKSLDSSLTELPGRSPRVKDLEMSSGTIRLPVKTD